jgi:hypothetical protein
MIFPWPLLKVRGKKIPSFSLGHLNVNIKKPQLGHKITIKAKGNKDGRDERYIDLHGSSISFKHGLPYSDKFRIDPRH